MLEGYFVSVELEVCLQNLLVSLDKVVLDPADMVHFVTHSLTSPLEAATPSAGRLGKNQLLACYVT